jgi:hypothetical protein
MKTFVAQIIYRIECAGVEMEQYEEQWRLVMGADGIEALDNSRTIAKEEESIFIDRHGRTVSWKLIAVKYLQEIDLTHGALLMSQVKEITPIADPIWIEQ